MSDIETIMECLPQINPAILEYDEWLAVGMAIKDAGGSVQLWEEWSRRDPLSTVATTGSIGMVEPFIVEYYGQGGAVPLDIPLHTVTTKDRFGVVEGRTLMLPDGRSFRLDITHRMLTARGLAAATSFPENYVFCGGDTAAKKQIGNAVPPVLAEALYRAVLAA